MVDCTLNSSNCVNWPSLLCNCVEHSVGKVIPHLKLCRHETPCKLGWSTPWYFKVQQMSCSRSSVGQTLGRWNSSSSSRCILLTGHQNGVSVNPFLASRPLSHPFRESIVLKWYLKYPKLTLCTLLEKGPEGRIRLLGIFKRPISQLKSANSAE